MSSLSTGSCWAPSAECLRVLSQIGFDIELLKRTQAEYSVLLIEFPNLLEASDKAFVTHLKAIASGENALVQQALSNQSPWLPSTDEILALEDEGYWRDVIDRAVLDFKIEHLSKSTILESRFAAFRAYLHRYLPLPNCAGPQWRPNHIFQSLAFEKFAIPRSRVTTIWQEFDDKLLSPDVEVSHIPRRFYRHLENLNDSALPIHRSNTASMG